MSKLQAPSPLLVNDTIPRATQICAQMNWARTFCLLEVHLVPRLSSYWKLQLPQGRVGWICALRGVFHFVLLISIYYVPRLKQELSWNVSKLEYNLEYYKHTDTILEPESVITYYVPSCAHP